MVALAIAIFVGVFLFGGDTIGWYDPEGHVRLGLFMAYVLGIVCGYRIK